MSFSNVVNVTVLPAGTVTVNPATVPLSPLSQVRGTQLGSLEGDQEVYCILASGREDVAVS